LLVWGFVVDRNMIPSQHPNGVSYATFTWLRIVACGAVLQSLFIPLIDRPTELRRFLAKNGLSGTIGTLVITSVIFLPEVRRRLDRIIDARKANGFPVSGFSGLRQLPSLLMPLVSSLFESADKRAELWSHRGVLARERAVIDTVAYTLVPSIFALLLSTAMLVMVMII